MELLCTERVSPEEAGSRAPSRSAAPDPVLLRRRVLDNLLKTEERYHLTANYFGTVQREVTPDMRRLLAEWMLEVCEDQNCQEEVFSLAMTYLDRFLSICAISKNQLQLLGCACLLVASKLREPRENGLPGDVLVFFTANSITLDDLRNWELLVLSKLKWDMACVTPNDFLPLLVPRVLATNTSTTTTTHPSASTVTRHAQTFIALAARDIKFSLYSASTVAASSISAALRGFGAEGRLQALHQLTHVDRDCLLTCLEHIEHMVQHSIDERAILVPTTTTTGSSEPHSQHQQLYQQQQQQQQRLSDKQQEEQHSSAATPTDVRDVHF